MRPPSTSTCRVLVLLALSVVANSFWMPPAGALGYEILCPRPGRPQPSFGQVRQQLLRLEMETADYYNHNGRQPVVQMCNLNLGGGDFRNLQFPTEIRNVNFAKAKLDGATIHPGNVAPRLNFAGASLLKANFGGHLEGVNFDRADLRGASFVFADLNHASFLLSKVEGTWFDANLYGATFVPEGIPAESNGMGGLEGIRYPEGARPWVEALRNHYRSVGLRDNERELTHAIEANTTRHIFSHADAWFDDGPFTVSVTSLLGGLFRFVIFDLPTAYGLYPGRALLLIVLAWVALVPIYRRAIVRRPRNGRLDGIYLNLPAERLVKRGHGAELATSAKTIRLTRNGRSAWKWAAYFSLLSAFHVGFREINVGSWIERTQTRKFQLEAVGASRRIAGFQSLLSLFLLAMWILTYFGRPFQ